MYRYKTVDPPKAWLEYCLSRARSKGSAHSLRCALEDVDSSGAHSQALHSKEDSGRRHRPKYMLPSGRLTTLYMTASLAGDGDCLAWGSGDALKLVLVMESATPSPASPPSTSSPLYSGEKAETAH